MPETLEEKKAHLETLFEEYKHIASRMQEIYGEVPRVAKPLMEMEYGAAGVLAWVEIFVRFMRVIKEIEAVSNLGSNSNRAN